MLRTSVTSTKFVRAVEFKANGAPIHGALMAAGRPREAIVAVRRALSIDPEYAPARDNLRRLEAMGIR